MFVVIQYRVPYSIVYLHNIGTFSIGLLHPLNISVMSLPTSQKRTADDFMPTDSTQFICSTQDTIRPLIVHRHHHRRSNIATSAWGPEEHTHFTSTSSTKVSPSCAVLEPPFNIYKSLLQHPNLFFQCALRLPYDSIISLYAIDKEFHYRLNKHTSP